RRGCPSFSPLPASRRRWTRSLPALMPRSGTCGMTLSIPAARSLFLAAQGLHQPPAHAAAADVLAAIRRMNGLQIDTISVVARSQYLVLWSRLGSYEPRWLDDLLPQGAVFEYWSHAICFLPIEDFPIYRWRMLERAQGDLYLEAYHPKGKTAVHHALEQIRANRA